MRKGGGWLIKKGVGFGMQEALRRTWDTDRKTKSGNTEVFCSWEVGRQNCIVCRVGGQMAWVQIPALPLTRWRTLRYWLSLPQPQPPHPYHEHRKIIFIGAQVLTEVMDLDHQQSRQARSCSINITLTRTNSFIYEKTSLKVQVVVFVFVFVCFWFCLWFLFVCFCFWLKISNLLDYKQFSSIKCFIALENKDNTHFGEHWLCAAPGMALSTACVSHSPLTAGKVMGAVKSALRRKPAYSVAMEHLLRSST